MKTKTTPEMATELEELQNVFAELEMKGIACVAPDLAWLKKIITYAEDNYSCPFLKIEMSLSIGQSDAYVKAPKGLTRKPMTWQEHIRKFAELMSDRWIDPEGHKYVANQYISKHSNKPTETGQGCTNYKEQ